MLHWLLSNHAQKDRAAFLLSGLSGYGLMTGERIGHVAIVNRLLLLGSDVALTLKAYDQSTLSGFDVPLGLFTLETGLPPGFSFHGLVLSLGRTREEMACWRWGNGSIQLTRAIMEKFND